MTMMTTTFQAVHGLRRRRRRCKHCKVCDDDDDDNDDASTDSRYISEPITEYRPGEEDFKDLWRVATLERRISYVTGFSVLTRFYCMTICCTKSGFRRLNWVGGQVGVWETEVLQWGPGAKPRQGVWGTESPEAGSLLSIDSLKLRPCITFCANYDLQQMQ